MAKAKSNVGLYLRYRTPENKQSPYRPVAWDAKKRIRPGWCMVDGVAEQHTDVTYHLRFKEDGKWMWEAVGGSARSGVRTLCLTWPTLLEMAILRHIQAALLTYPPQMRPNSAADLRCCYGQEDT